MLQDNDFDPARIERLGRRLQVLEDSEMIRNLKAHYAALCDQQYDADRIRDRAATFFHPSGTCRVGTEPTAGVPELRANGVQGLRVVGASIMPAALNARTHAPAIMLGEKGAALIARNA